MLSLPSFLFIFILFLLPLRANADVRTEIDTTTYDVYIDGGATLREALNAASPIRHEGKVFHAYTSWKVAWRFFRQEQGDGTCRITNVATQLTAAIRLPALLNGTDEQRRIFFDYLKALQEHEMGHVAIGHRAAEKIDHALSTLAPVYGCDFLDERANRLAKSILNEFSGEDELYDRRTNHGPRLP